MRRLLTIAVFVLALAPQSVHNQTIPEDGGFKPYVPIDGPMPTNWYCLDPAPAAVVEKTVFCHGKWMEGECTGATSEVYGDPEHPSSICSLLSFFSF